jgi:hypothetical protein
MPPITIIVASNKPSWRRGFDLFDVVMSSEVETSLILKASSQRFLDFARNDTLENLRIGNACSEVTTGVCKSQIQPFPRSVSSRPSTARRNFATPGRRQTSASTAKQLKRTDSSLRTSQAP